MKKRGESFEAVLSVWVELVWEQDFVLWVWRKPGGRGCLTELALAGATFALAAWGLVRISRRLAGAAVLLSFGVPD